MELNLINITFLLVLLQSKYTLYIDYVEMLNICYETVRLLAEKKCDTPQLEYFINMATK